MTHLNRPLSTLNSTFSPGGIARKASGRSNWHRRASKPVTLWMFALLILIFVHRWVPNSLWLMVHMVTLGLITNSILIWSQHFCEALLKLKVADDARKVQVGRIYGLNVAMMVLMIGVVFGLYPLTIVGSASVGLLVAWHGLYLLQQLRVALPARFDSTVRFYIAAAWLFPVGATFGAILAHNSADEELYARLLLSHETVNVLGFVGLTVVGTLMTLWPTMLRTKMHPQAVKLSRTSLWGMCAGIAVTTMAALANMRLLAGAGLLIYAVALLVIAYLMVRTCSTKKPREYPTLSVTAGFIWLIIGVLWVGLMVLSTNFADLHLRAVTPIFVAGFLLQVLLGAMSYLLPARMGGGPAAVRAANKEFNRFSFGRVTIINLCLFFFVLPAELTGSWVRATTSIVGALTFAMFIPLMVRGVKRSVAARKEMIAARARGETPAKRTPDEVQLASVNARREVLLGGGAALAAVAAGVALNPSSSRFLRINGSNLNTDSSGVTRISVEATSDMRFVPDSVVVPHGNSLIIDVKNTDSTNVHDLLIDANGGCETGRIDPGATKTLDAGVINGNAEGWCTIVGHRAMGMTFSVISDNAASTHSHGSIANSESSARNETLMASSDIDFSAKPGKDFTTRDAVLQPIDTHTGTGADANEATVHHLTFDIAELQSEIAPGVSVNAWTFNGKYMGPVLRGALGDIFEITLKNGGSMGHSVDFHAGMVSPGSVMRTIAPGESLVYRFEATGSGIWLYHCSTMPMSAHIAAGMFGAVIIDPVSLSTVEREFVLVQNETYLTDTGKSTGSGNKITNILADAVADGVPTLTLWNGHATQYVDKPLQARVGEKVRLWVLAAGPSLGCSFHVVGSQFHTVYKEGAYLLRDARDAFGVDGGHAQTLDLTSAQGGFVEMEFTEAGTYTFVNHSFAQMERGARGLIEVKQ
ncbi:MAG: multicopper oxidase domain-containing protein [Rothia sp. (in: high G+C Gram-positive bacteria)]|nr:multicopper oxidase domain-containing protein [Rothia sp. (in: high G+C Gram-positive bacteria)]